MKTFAFGFGTLLIILGASHLVNRGGYSYKLGELHPYQSIGAGTLMIGIGCYSLFYSKPHKTFGLPKNKKDKIKRIKHVRFLGICFLCGALGMSFFVPGGYDQPLELRDLREVPTTFLQLLAGAIILYLPVSLIAYLSREI